MDARSRGRGLGLEFVCSFELAAMEEVHLEFMKVRSEEGLSDLRSWGRGLGLGIFCFI